MEGRRRRLRIINRPWYHRLHQFQKQPALIIIVVVISVAIWVWDLKHEELTPAATESSGTDLKLTKEIITEQRIFIENMKKKLSDLHNFWPDHILHSTCFLLFPAFSLTTVGPRNLKRFLRIMAKSFGGIYKRNNYIVHGVNLFLLFAFIVIAYVYLFMFYTVCATYLEAYIGFSVAGGTHRKSPEQENMIKYSFQQEVAPYFSAKVTRYDMEDVLMICRLLVACETNIPTIFNSFRWIKDGKRVVKKTDKIHIITNAYKKKRDSKSSPYCDTFIIETKLAIEVIDRDDYGKYSCEFTHAKLAGDFMSPLQVVPEFEGMHSSYPLDGFIPHPLPKQKIGQARMADATTEIFANYYLQRKIMSLQEVNILPGGLFIEHVPYWSLADPGDIIVNETIWGKDNKDCCWLPFWFYKVFFDYGAFASRLKIGLGRQRFLLRQQCVCVKDFLALKNFSFTRIRYNSTSKSKQVIQVHYPQHFKLAHRVITPLMDIPQLFSTVGALLLFGIVFLIPVFIIFFILRFCLRSVLEVIWTPLKSSLKNSSLAEHRHRDYDYDLYLTYYDENDRYELELAQKLKECLDLDGTACRVFDAWIDVPPGYPLLDERQRAIGKSRRFCVVISEESANDGEKILEFTAIKQTLVDRMVAGTETEDCKFVIQIGDCARDGFLIPGNVTLSEYSRENNELDASVLRKFLKWARHSTRSGSRSSFNGVAIECLVVTITTCIFVALVFYSGAFKVYRLRRIDQEFTRLFYEADC